MDVIKDMNMLVLLPGGRERTEAEFRDLFKAAEFKLTNIFSAESGHSVIEGVKELIPLLRGVRGVFEK